MTEIPLEKKEVSPDEIYRRSAQGAPGKTPVSEGGKSGMSNKQLSSHLKRQHRNRKEKLDGLFSTVLSIVFDSTKTSGQGGKLSPFLQ